MKLKMRGSSRTLIRRTASELKCASACPLLVGQEVQMFASMIYTTDKIERLPLQRRKLLAKLKRLWRASRGTPPHYDLIEVLNRRLREKTAARPGNSVFNVPAEQKQPASQGFDR